MILISLFSKCLICKKTDCFIKYNKIMFSFLKDKPRLLLNGVYLFFRIILTEQKQE